MIKLLLVLAVFGLLISSGSTAMAIWFAMGVAVVLIVKAYAAGRIN